MIIETIVRVNSFFHYTAASLIDGSPQEQVSLQLRGLDKHVRAKYLTIPKSEFEEQGIGLGTMFKIHVSVASQEDLQRFYDQQAAR